MSLFVVGGIGLIRAVRFGHTVEVSVNDVGQTGSRGGMANILEMCFKKTRRAASDEIAFDASMLKLLVAIDAHKTIRQVAGEVRMPPSEFKEAILKLIKFRMIEPVTEKTECLDASFISRMEAVLVELTGPLGTLLVKDAAEKMNLSPTRIPRSRALEFIADVAARIPGEKQSEAFVETMQRELKEKEDALDP